MWSGTSFSSSLDSRRRIDASPEVPRAQLFATAGLEVQEQLHAVDRALTSSLGELQPARAHHAQVLHQLNRAALLGCRAIVELGAVDLACQVQQDADFVLQRRNQLGLAQDHDFLHAKRAGFSMRFILQ